MQASGKDLDNFLKWLQEAETTVNVLADTSQQEHIFHDTVLVNEFIQQMQASAQKNMTSACLPLRFITMHYGIHALL